MIRCLAGLLLAAGSLMPQTAAPTLTAMDPASIPAGGPDLALTVTGTNFQSGSVVSWNGFPLSTIPFSLGRLTASVPASLLITPGVVTVTVISGGTRSNGLLFTILPSQVVITTPSLPQAAVGISYSAALTASGGTIPYRWSANGALPPGLSLNPNGTIDGIPTIAGTFEFTLQVADAFTQSVAKAFSITVRQPQVSITTSQLPDGVVGQSYSQTLAASGGTVPYRWAVGQGFPSSLALNPTTGLISGTPATAGAFSFTVQVTDANQTSATRSFTLTIKGLPLTITTVPPLFSGTVGVPYAQSFLASGGVQPYRWTIASGDTGGLTLDAASGTLQGTPQTAGAFTFTVQVTDGASVSAAKSFSLTVNPPALTIPTGSVLRNGSVGVSYTQSFSAVGGTAPYTWSLVNGNLAGLALDPTGVLSGVPTASGVFTFTLMARDTAGLSATKTFTLTISASALTITTATELPNAVLNQPFSYAMTAAGGAPPYIWSVNGLPDGLQIDGATGLISGTPASAGTYAFTVRVTDSARSTFLELFRLVVNLPPAPSATISGLPQTAGPAEQFPLKVTLNSPFPALITGQAVLSFAPDSGGGDSTIQFASGGRTANFIVAAESLDAVSAVPLAIQTGTVAGTITVSLRLQAGGLDITQVPAPSAAVRIDRAAPVAQSARVVRTSSGLAVEITGFSTAREVTQASFTFNAGAGATLQNSTVTVAVEDLFRTWFQDPSSSQYGSQFVFSQPFTIQGDASLVIPQSVTLTNRVGSATVSVQP